MPSRAPNAIDGCIPQDHPDRRDVCVSSSLRSEMVNLRMSLTDMLGADYIDAVCEARAFAEGADKQALANLASEKVDMLQPMLAALLR